MQRSSKSTTSVFFVVSFALEGLALTAFAAVGPNATISGTRCSLGIALFGAHTTAHKVSIERENFKAIQVSDLSKLSAEKVFERLIRSLSEN